MSNSEESPRGGNPPWLPFKTLLGFIEWMGEVGVPQRIERSFWAKKLAGNMGPMVISSLQFFGLIDENSHSTEALDAIAQDADMRKAFFARQLKEKYGAALDGVNLERATRGQIKDRFADVFGARGSVLTKAVIFFVHMARFAGANVSNHIIIRERSASVRPRKKKSIEKEHVGQDPPPHPATPSPTPPKAAAPEDHADAQESLLLWGLFKRLPKPRAQWPKEERQRWLDTLQNVIALEYLE